MFGSTNPTECSRVNAVFKPVSQRGDIRDIMRFRFAATDESSVEGRVNTMPAPAFRTFAVASALIIAPLLWSGTGCRSAEPATRSPTTQQSMSADGLSKAITNAVLNAKLEKVGPEERPGLMLRSIRFVLDNNPEYRNSMIARAQHEAIDPDDRMLGAALQAVVFDMIDAGDRDGLLKVLARNVPEFLGSEPLELALAKSTLDQPLRILLDAYTSADAPACKTSIAVRLMSAFALPVQNAERPGLQPTDARAMGLPVQMDVQQMRQIIDDLYAHTDAWTLNVDYPNDGQGLIIYDIP